MSALHRPDSSEYAEYYARYVAQVPDGDILQILRDQLGDTLALLQSVPEARETYRYAEGKWSLREVVGHVVDSERVFGYRALHMVREPGIQLPAMAQDAWVSASRADARTLDDLCGEWAAVRRANLHFFATLNEEEGARTGVASGFQFSVRSFPWIIAGHELWHCYLLRRDYLAEAG
jgi:hypothetical protein